VNCVLFTRTRIRPNSVTIVQAKNCTFINNVNTMFSVQFVDIDTIHRAAKSTNIVTFAYYGLFNYNPYRSMNFFEEFPQNVLTAVPSLAVLLKRYFVS